MASRLVGLCGLRDCVDKKEQQMLPAAVNNMLFLGVFQRIGRVKGNKFQVECRQAIIADTQRIFALGE